MKNADICSKNGVDRIGALRLFSAANPTFSGSSLSD